MAIYVKWTDVVGDVTAEGFADHLEVNSLQFGVGRGIGSPMGGSAEREASATSISEVVLTKVMDKASVPIMEQALHGEGKTITIKLTKTDKDKLEVFCEYILEECLVSGYSV